MISRIIIASERTLTGIVLLFVLGCLWWIWQIGAQPGYATEALPGMLVGGAGVGLVLPAFTIAATSTLPPTRLATGIGAQTMFRQIGATLGVAAFVAILGTPGPGDVLDAFDHTRWFMSASAVAAALALLLVRRAAPRRAAPTTAAEPAQQVS